MLHQEKAIVFFDATHEDTSESSSPHGHRFNVVAIEQTEEKSDLLSDLRVIAAELHLRPLSHMIGGANTRAGIASWFMERLLSTHPRTISVEVWWNADESSIVTREIR